MVGRIARRIPSRVLSKHGAVHADHPLGIVIVGGLMFSLVLSLFVVPGVYSAIGAGKLGKKG